MNRVRWGLIGSFLTLLIIVGTVPSQAQQPASSFKQTDLSGEEVGSPEVARQIDESGMANNAAINFTRKTIFSSTSPDGSLFQLPTVITYGPDGRLYVGQLDGRIFALTLDDLYNVTDVEMISRIHDLPNENDDGSPAPEVIGRELLGLVFDPTAPITAPVLYAAHSDPRIGDPSSSFTMLIDTNSSTITRLTGPNWHTGPMEHVIVGLPRSRENHAVNSVVWGPDGWLYIAQAGNTNNGAPSLTFGHLPETFLTATILRANVRSPGFPTGIDVTDFDEYTDLPMGQFEIYATGYRDVYDFTWHSNGNLYANNNGANPSFGDTPGPDTCPGGVAIDPGYLDDELELVEQGDYGGHPNPARGECVLENGQYYSPTLQPEANYRLPLATYYGGASTNGMVEYTAPTFGGALVGDMIAATFSSDQNVRRIKLKPDGTVDSITTLGAFSQPLDVTTNDEGVILVAEFGGSQITALMPNPPLVGLWKSQPVMPSSRSEVGVATYANEMYVFGGVDAAGTRLNTVEVYNPFEQTWSARSPIPGAPLDHIGTAAISMTNTIYLVGGLTSWPSGAVNTVRIYRPLTDTWDLAAPLPEARGAASVVELDGKLYALGGLTTNGQASNSVFVYDPALNTWSVGVPMPTARDHLTAQVVDGKIYAIGGREQAIPAVIGAVEIFDPATNMWTAGASVPLPRGGLSSGVLDDRIIVFGGEGGPNGVFAETQEYNPATNTWRTLAPMITPRHGTGGASIAGVIFAPAGAPTEGLTATNKHEAFTLTDFSLGGACPIPNADPLTTDSDEDGYLDQDEIDNNTDRCNQASIPVDFDRDFISDINDPDDDNDTIPDVSDQLHLDAYNGTNTALPLYFGWNPGDQPLGYVGNTGFTGVQITSGPNRVALENISVGGAGGFFAIIATSGTNAGLINTQENAFQLGFDATRPFRIETRLAEPWFGKFPDGEQAGGLFVGLDQDNYIKLVATASTDINGATGSGLEFAVETHSHLVKNPTGNNVPLNFPGPSVVDLRLDGDPSTMVFTASYRLTSTSEFEILGAISAHDYPALTRFFRPSLSTGLMATSHNAQASMAFVYDFFALDYPGLEPLIAINAGGPTIVLTNTNGTATTWLSDAEYIVGGNLNETYSDIDHRGLIGNTTLDELYISERNGGNIAPLHFAIPVPEAGPYIVDLHFAEIYFGVDGPAGRRSFDVRLEDTTVLQNYDVAAAAGGKLRAKIERETIDVTDGVLDIYLDATRPSSVDRAKISAIAVYQPPARALVPQPVYVPLVRR